MNPDIRKRHFVGVMAKHLPPSSSKLRLLDINGQAGDILSERRKDLEIVVTQADQLVTWEIVPNSLDAVVGYDVLPEPILLDAVLDAMRAGGRLTLILSTGQVQADYVELLENHGYVRILVEPVLDDLGVLIRGEKAHITDDTLERIQQVATIDADKLNLDTFKGQYVHLLIHQTPNKPVWKLTPDEEISWQAVAIQRDGAPVLLAFSSLPKAVGFMQPAVLEGVIQDINKVGKFSKTTAQNWSWRVTVNPTLDLIRDESLVMVDIDPNTAEAPDE